MYCRIFITKSCKFCLSLFTTSDKRKIFCCNKCAIKQHTKDNPEKNREKARKYAMKNREAVRVRFRKWRNENLEKAKNACKKWRKENPEIARSNKEKYRKKHPDRVNSANRRRKSAKRGVYQEKFENIDIFERDNWVCHICKKLTKGKKHPNYRSPTIDHIIPTSKGGADAPFNVACACLKCNIKKSDNVITLF